MNWLMFKKKNFEKWHCLSGSSGGGGGGTSEIRYAPYIESHHKRLLNMYKVYANEAKSPSNNPYSSWENIDIDAAFFGRGYVLASFPSLYDMFGKFMAGLDIETLYSQIFTSTVSSPQVKALITAEGTDMTDDIEANVLPKFQTGMRDINAVMTSSYIIGKSLIEESRIKALASFSAKFKAQLVPLAVTRWQTSLEWNRNTVATYMEVMKYYFAAKAAIEEVNYGYEVKYLLWPFTAMEYYRVAVGTMQGARSQTTAGDEPSTASKVLGGAASGAAIGSMVGGPVGAGIGAGVGALAGLIS